MSEAASELVSAAQRLADGSRRTRLWIDDVRAQAVSVANEAHGLTTSARKAENLARKLVGAAGRRNCVGVFGPSQAGKSYLVSALARRPMTKLTADFAGDEKDFLTQINPAGDRESTGLVTRFTAHKSPVDREHPVELRLLSETDLVKILANSFYSDFDPNNMAFKLPDEAAIREALVAAQADAAGAAAAHLDEITLYDLSEYFQSNFKARIDALTRVEYWDGLITTAGRLSLEKRAKLYSMLWGGIDAFTRLFIDLARALETLGFAQEARAELGALVPREKSIIDVAILRYLGTDEDKADAISVRPLQDGQPAPAVKLPRATLTALVAELKIVMTDSPWPFFTHTDLLDFPGARSRLKLPSLPADPAECGAQVRELLLRGKIAYLFQRFTEERELTAMLLCMPPSVAEVKDLASMVKSWINLTHGPTPKQRSQVRNALFLILTKFDLEFLEKGGETAESRRSKWDRRLYASLLELYGKDEWVGNWDGKPFANSLFLRNPGMKQKHLMDYEEIVKEPDGSERLIEAGPAREGAALIDEYQTAFMDSELVGKHFERRQETWAAAFAPNDGGVGFLVERLNEVLDPHLKKQQIGERLNEQAGELEDSLRRFYHADDDASRREKEQALMDLRRQLFTAIRARKFQNFAHLVECLLMRERDAREIFLNVAALRLVDAPAEAPAAKEADPWADDPWAAAPAGGEAQPAAPVHAVDRPAIFATNVMNHWTEGLRTLSQSDEAMRALGLEPRLVDDLVQELIVGAHRQEITAGIAAGVRAQVQSANVRWDDVADRAGSIAAEAINDYVSYLGFGVLPEAKRPGFPEPPKEPTRAIFAAPPMADGLPALGSSRLALEQVLFLDWGVALRQLGLDNVSFAGGREIDEAQNRALGQILETIAIAPLVRQALAV